MQIFCTSLLIQRSATDLQGSSAASPGGLASFPFRLNATFFCLPCPLPASLTFSFPFSFSVLIFSLLAAATSTSSRILFCLPLSSFFRPVSAHRPTILPLRPSISPKAHSLIHCSPKTSAPPLSLEPSPSRVWLQPHPDFPRHFQRQLQGRPVHHRNPILAPITLFAAGIASHFPRRQVFVPSRRRYRGNRRPSPLLHGSRPNPRPARPQNVALLTTPQLRISRHLARVGDHAAGVMLKTSPSVNTSPNPLRYAASRSPHTSPRQLTDKLRHSPSTMSPAVRNTMQSIRSPPIGEPTQNAAAAIAAPKPPSVAATTTDASQTAHQLPTTAAVPDELLRSPVKRRSDDANAAPNTADTLEEVDEVDQDDELQRSKRHRGDVLPEKVLPSRYDLCPVDDMVELIAHMLGELISTNDAIRISTGGLTRFHSRFVVFPRISLPSLLRLPSLPLPLFTHPLT